MFFVKKAIRRAKAVPRLAGLLSFRKIRNKIKKRKERRREQKQGPAPSEPGKTQTTHPLDMESETSDDDQEECVICFRAIRDEVLQLKCSHEFHEHCLREWLDQQSVCPFCHDDLQYLLEPV